MITLFFFFLVPIVLSFVRLLTRLLINPMSAVEKGRCGGWRRGGRREDLFATVHLSPPSPPHFSSRPASLSELSLSFIFFFKF